MSIDLSFAFKLPPEKAIEYFKSKGYTFSWDWHDTWQEAHSKAFTIAKTLRVDVLEDVRAIVQKSLDDGITLQQFKRELMPKIARRGWGADRVDMEVLKLADPWRIRTIYQTNLQTAYMAGRYKEMMQNVADRPYWQYVAVMDKRTRPAHAALHGKVFRYDDPFWNSHYPPLGFRCRCRVSALSSSDVREQSLPVEDSKDRITYEDKLISRKTGELRQVAVYKDPFTGLKIPTDPGWSYNPGKAWADPFTPRPFSPSQLEGGIKQVGLTDYPKPPIEKLPAKKLAKDMLLPPHQKSGWTDEQYVNAFLSEFGTEIGAPVVYRDVIGDPVVISEELFKDRLKGTYKVIKADREVYLKLLSDTIKDPTEIWVTWVEAGGKTRICKRYIGLYEDKGKLGGYAVFDLIDDMWQGTTTFKAADLTYLDNQRTGKLMYAKK